MVYKEVIIIPTSCRSFVQFIIEDWWQNTDKKYANQKLILGELLIGKISFGIKFPLNYAPFVETF
jgi:hypothetical protein